MVSGAAWSSAFETSAETAAMQVMCGQELRWCFSRSECQRLGSHLRVCLM